MYLKLLLPQNAILVSYTTIVCVLAGTISSGMSIQLHCEPDELASIAIYVLRAEGAPTAYTRLEHVHV